MNETLLKTTALYELLGLEQVVVLISFFLVTWFFYKVFLRSVSPERHKNLQGHYRNLLSHLFIAGVLYLVFLAMSSAESSDLSLRSLPYVALACYFWGLIVLIKTSRLVILQYLFLGSMKHGVPVLIVNIVSLVLSIGLGLWSASHLFGLQLAPLIATSAALSIILGLALQDTLGNLFAGISLQIDQSFDIGDWLEVISGTQKISGQVQEISWRATILSGWSDESIVVPNRTLANSQILNYSLKDTPIIRAELFRLDVGTPVKEVRETLALSIRDLEGIRKWPEPVVLLSETTDSWMTFKLCYWIDNYGMKNILTDAVIEKAVEALESKGLKLARQKMEISKQ